MKRSDLKGLALWVLGTALVTAQLACNQGQQAVQPAGERTSIGTPAPNAASDLSEKRSDVLPLEPRNAAEPATQRRLAPVAPVTPERAMAAPSGARFAVAGVASDDVLNLRSQPDAESSLVAAIPHDATGLVGLGDPQIIGRSLWRKVRHGSVEGWVNARFLSSDKAPAAGGRSRAASSELPLVCFGTEPFWRLDLRADGTAGCSETCEGPGDLRFDVPSGPLRHLKVVRGSGQTFLDVSIKKTGRCSDDMSDEDHLYELVAKGPGQSLKGCCNPPRVSADDE